jgi:hypothetical protein
MRYERHDDGDRKHLQADHQQLIGRKGQPIEICCRLAGERGVLPHIHPCEEQAERDDARQDPADRPLERLFAGVVEKAEAEERLKKVAGQQRGCLAASGAHDRTTCRISSARPV